MYYEKVLEKILNSNSTVLDICCGDGAHSITLAKCGAKTFATDLSEESVTLGKLRARALNLENIYFSKEDAEKN
ncbi:MAG: methyltransferase domain-containing protein [Bacteroidales bacterium]|nr:methyltransferase domain-containing protein [Bacteroidales bacterium]